MANGTGRDGPRTASLGIFAAMVRAHCHFGPGDGSPMVPAAESSALDFVRLFTDGACSGNPGPGGWAFILRHPATGKELQQSGGETETTNNRMELMAVIRGLEALKRATHVELFTDSEYVRQGLSLWM